MTAVVSAERLRCASWFAGLLPLLAVACAEQPLPAPETLHPEPLPPLASTAAEAPPPAIEARAVAPAPPAPPPPSSCEARRGADGLRRAAVLRALDGGLGNWLRRVDIDPQLDHGRFRGWIIRTLPQDDACYEDLDLRAGDVVTRINGRPVERPEEASQIWDGLRTSTALVIDFTRGGHARTLRLKIVEP